jgi:hypothetical protein
MPEINTNYKYTAGLLVFMTIALLLRVYGIDWGLPSAAHPEYSYHPDELLTFTLAKLLVLGKILDKHFIYGGTLYYTILNAFTYFGNIFTGVLGGINQFADGILVGRYFLVFVALLTILLIYECGRQFNNDKRIGILSALLLAIFPAHVVWAQRVRPDEITALVTAIILLLSIKILASRENSSLKYFVYSGLAVGVAASLRLPLVVFILAPLTASLLTRDGPGFVAKALSMLDRQTGVLIVSVIMAFAITSPHVFLYPEHFTGGLLRQWRYQTDAFPDAVGRGPGVYQYGWLMMHQALGYGLYTFAVLGVLLAFYKRTKVDILLLVIIVPYFFMMTLTSWVVVRYTLPLLPVLALLAARFFVYVIDNFPGYRIVISALFLATTAWTLAADLAYLRIEAGKDIRDVAAEWIGANIPAGSSVLTVKTYREDYYFNPVISENLHHEIFYLSERSDSRALFRDSKSEYLVLNEYLYKDMERLGNRHPSKQSRIFYDSLLNSRYKLIKAFKYPIEFLGLDFSTSFSSFDYTIINPGIRIYKRE